MSRAFVKEDIEEPERLTQRRAASGLPPGAQNLMTADGAQRLQDRLVALKQMGLGGTDEARYAQEVLDSATIVEPRPKADPTIIVFGSRVTLRGEDGGVKTHRIVGVDEVDLEPGNVSWVSALGKVLLAAQVGHSVRMAPGGKVLGTVAQVE
ncbi:MAG: GreA/GreB family elongation factor [Prosthecobacter sp.]